MTNIHNDDLLMYLAGLALPDTVRQIQVAEHSDPEIASKIDFMRHILSVNKQNKKRTSAALTPIEKVFSLKIDKGSYNSDALARTVDQFAEWHAAHLEPLNGYPRSVCLAREWLSHRKEKKLVAKFLCKAKVHNSSTIVCDDDTVIIPDGSSAFYVGLAIAAYRRNISIVSSNGPLYFEFVSNPSFAKALNSYHCIGGMADPDSGGVVGMDAQQSYSQAIRLHPQKTIVIMPVTGLLPDQGPFASNEKMAALKYSLIRDCDHQMVRDLVFVTDYTKHRPSSTNKYGVPIFQMDGWHQLLLQHKSLNISIVTAPPPRVRNAVLSLYHSAPTHVEDGIPIHNSTSMYKPIDQEYLSVARAFRNMYCDYPNVRFHEVYTMDTHRNYEWAKDYIEQGVSSLK